MRTTMSSLAWAGPAPAMASRIWRSRLRGPRTANARSSIVPPPVTCAF